MDDPFLRQRDILTPDQAAGVDIDIVGAGSLGGAILVCLCKMGFGIRGRITVTDFDRCESHNLATQWFRGSDVLRRRPKAEALEEMVAWICSREIVAVDARFTGQEGRRLGPVVILAVDSLEERRRIWNRLKRRREVRFVLDARMGAELVEIYCVETAARTGEGRGDDHAAAIAEYEGSLESDGEEYPEPCTRRAIFYTVLGAAAFAGSLLRAYVLGEEYPRHIAFDFRNFFLEVGTGARAVQKRV
jgi:hypothetical protein